MKTHSGSFYLVLAPNKKGYARGLTARITARRPRLSGNEVELTLDVEVPSSLFERPALSAKVSVPDGQTLSSQITADVADNLGKLVSERMGMSVQVSALPPGPVPHWSNVLGIRRDASTTEAREAYRTMHALLLDDETADPEQMAALNRAYSQACREAEIQETA
jgi:hypothetical protein